MSLPHIILRDLSPAQMGASLAAGIWFLFVPGYWNPRQAHEQYSGGAEPTKYDVLNAMAISSYCGFFGLTCALAATDRTASQLVMAVQTLMCAFFIRFHYVVTPQLNILSHETLTMLRRVWMGSLAIGLTTLGLDWKMMMHRQQKN